MRTISLREVLLGTATSCLLATMLCPLLPTRSAEPEYAVSLKQLGLCTYLYSGDWNDVLPLASTFENEVWNLRPVSVPQGWYTLEPPQKLLIDGNFWANSVRPYYKDRRLLEIPGARLRWSSRPTPQSPGVPQYAGWTFNGLLHSLSQSEIAVPSRGALFWAGMGNENRAGEIWSNPGLLCPNPGPCRYQVGQPPQPGSVGGVLIQVLSSMDVDHGTTPILTPDLSLRQIPVRSRTEDPPGDSSLTLASSYWENGTIEAYAICGTASFGYPCFFEPGRDDWATPSAGNRPQNVRLTAPVDTKEALR